MKTARKRKFQLLSAIMISILSFLLIMVIPGCFNPELEGHVKITDQTTSFTEDTSANPVPLKVAVYKTDFMGPGYRVIYNYIDISVDTTVIPSGAIYGSDVDYDMAYYGWENDTTVLIILYNSDGIQEEFKLYGVPSRGGTGMEIIDDEAGKDQSERMHLIY